MTAPRSAERAARHRTRRLLAVVVVALVVVVVDQVSKTIAVDHLSNGPVHLLGPLSLDLSYNTGVAFSLGAGFTLPIIVIALVIVGLLAWFSRGSPSYPASVGIGLVLGGATGNLADRLLRGHGGAVVDFIHTGFWPTFNLADTSIVCGCAVLIVVLCRPGHKSDATRGPS